MADGVKDELHVAELNEPVFVIHLFPSEVNPLNWVAVADNVEGVSLHALSIVVDGCIAAEGPAPDKALANLMTVLQSIDEIGVGAPA